MISGFCFIVNEVLALQECNAVLIGSHRHFGTACQYTSSRAKLSKKNSWLSALKRRRPTASEHCMTFQKIEYLNIDLISSFQNFFNPDLLEFIIWCGIIIPYFVQCCWYKSFARPAWKILKSRHFSSNTEVIAATETWLNGQPSEFFSSGLQKLEFSRCSLFPSWSG